MKDFQCTLCMAFLCGQRILGFYVYITMTTQLELTINFYDFAFEDQRCSYAATTLFVLYLMYEELNLTTTFDV